MTYQEGRGALQLIAEEAIGSPIREVNERDMAKEQAMKDALRKEAGL